MQKVLTTMTRGTAKFTEEIDGMTEEFWKYNRKHVTDILGVGWKIEDDDESTTNALSLVRPEQGAIYPQTRILVKWRDAAITLEGRSFIRRITTGSDLDGDPVIYQRARELEAMYREKHGVDDTEDDDSGESFPKTVHSPHHPIVLGDTEAVYASKTRPAREATWKVCPLHQCVKGGENLAKDLEDHHATLSQAR